MTRFEFEATDAQGQPHSGTLDAVELDQAMTQLWNRGLTPVSLQVAERRSARGTSPLSEREVAELLDQLLALTRAGLPLPAGLRAASAELESFPLRRAFDRLANQLDTGIGLDSALVAEAGQFPAHLRGLLLAGARTGRLADVLGEVIQASNLGRELRGKVGATLAYPALILAIVLALTLFICHLSSRITADLVGDFAGLQGFVTDNSINKTASIYAITTFVANHDIWVVPGLAIVGGLGFLMWRFVFSPTRRQAIVEAVPLYGPLLRFVALAEFCHLTALLVEAETPLPEALRLAGGSVRDAALSATCGRIAERVAAGDSLTVALRDWTGLPASLGQLLAWGEDHQDLAGALRFAGDMFETRAETQASFTSQVASSLLLVMILWWIGFAVAAVYLPIMSMIQMISRLSG